MAAMHAELLEPEQAYGLEVFYERYGNVCGIEHDVLRLMWEESQSLMPPDDSEVYKHHNALHARMTVWALMEVCDRKEAEDPSYKHNRRVLILAGLFHDTHYDKDPKMFVPGMQFDSKEALSAYTMSMYALEYRFTNTEIDLAHAIIMVGKKGTEPRTTEQEDMIEADIINVSQDYASATKPTFLNLAVESIRVKAAQGEAFDFHKFSAESIELLCTYLSYLDRNTPFFKACVHNIQKLAGELAVKDGTGPVKYLYSIGSSTVNKVLGLHQPPFGRTNISSN